MKPRTYGSRPEDTWKKRVRGSSCRLSMRMRHKIPIEEQEGSVDHLKPRQWSCMGGVTVSLDEEPQEH